MIEIYEATAQDIPLIQRLAHQVWYVTYGPLQPKEKVDFLYNLMYSTSSLTEQMEKKNHKFLLAKDETGYLGYASYEINYKNQGKTKIHKIYVMPNAQGKGVGKELANHIGSIAKQYKNQAILLDVYRHNSAIQFYEKIGFKKVGEQITDVGNGFVMDDFVLEKSVP
ncbi:MAG: GNAT family N-acetyltransferase [Bacteroidetes bacterium]|nr:GNAT family N-acetyltransferase [Bacteroidota bacterium]